MRRSDVIRETVSQRGLVIANIGYPSRELYAIKDSARNFYMLGSMGMASSVGLGVACSQRRRVYVIDGDGSLLMNLGSLATIAHHAPANYCLIIVDNKAYGSTGNQPTYTREKTDLRKIAIGAGNVTVKRVKTVPTLRKALKTVSRKPLIIIADTDTVFADVPVIPLAPAEIKERFMREITKTSR